MLNQGEKDSLHKIVEKLNELDDLLTEKDIVHHFIEVIETNNEIQLNSNAEGCIYLASVLLNLAEKSIENKHFQLDWDGLADVCEKDITFTYKSAEWDNK